MGNNNNKDEESKNADEIMKSFDKTEELFDELEELEKEIEELEKGSDKLDEKLDNVATKEDWEKAFGKFDKSLLLAFNEREKKLCWYMLEGTGIGMAVGWAVYGIILFICHLLQG